MHETPPTPVAPPQALPLPEHARRVLVLVNRKAGSGRNQIKLHQMVEALAQADFPATVIADRTEFADAVRQAAESGELRAVVSVGGDGTFSLTLNSTPAGTPIAIYPFGTENLLARYLGHRRQPQEMVDLIQSGVVLPMDAVQVGDKLFSIVFSAGFDAEVVHRVHSQRRGNITHLAYAAPLFRAVTRYRFPKIRITATGPNDPPFSTTVCWAFAFNLPNYALGLPFAPHAVGHDGQVDLCLFERGSLVSGLRYFSQILRGRHHQLSDVCSHAGSSFRIEAANDDEIPYQIDGDPGGMLPVDLQVLPGRMHLLVTPEVARRLGFATVVG